MEISRNFKRDGLLGEAFADREAVRAIRWLWGLNMLNATQPPRPTGSISSSYCAERIGSDGFDTQQHSNPCLRSATRKIEMPDRLALDADHQALRSNTPARALHACVPD